MVPQLTDPKQGLPDPSPSSSQLQAERGSHGMEYLRPCQSTGKINPIPARTRTWRNTSIDEQGKRFTSFWYTTEFKLHWNCKRLWTRIENKNINKWRRCSIISLCFILVWAVWTKQFSHQSVGVINDNSCCHASGKPSFLEVCIIVLHANNFQRKLFSEILTLSLYESRDDEKGKLLHSDGLYFTYFYRCEDIETHSTILRASTVTEFWSGW